MNQQNSAQHAKKLASLILFYVTFCTWLITVMWSSSFQGSRSDLLFPRASWFSKWSVSAPQGRGGGTPPIFGYTWATEGLKTWPRLVFRPLIWTFYSFIFTYFSPCTRYFRHVWWACMRTSRKLCGVTTISSPEPSNQIWLQNNPCAIVWSVRDNST